MDRDGGEGEDEAKKQTLKRKASNNFHINRPENGNKGISPRSATLCGVVRLLLSSPQSYCFCSSAPFFSGSLRRRSFSPLHNIRIGDS
jgi:hypothetical protein